MRRGLAAFVVMLAACVAASAQTSPTQKPSPQAFTELFAKVLRAELPRAAITVDGNLLLRVGRSDGGSLTVNINKAYEAYSGNPAQLKEWAKAYVAALTEKQQAKLDRSRIVPVIKDRAWLDDLRKLFQAQGVNSEPVFDDFNKELVLVYAEDTPSRTRYLNSAENFGDRGALRALAVENLQRFLPKVERREHEAGFSLVSAGGNYEPSLLLLDHIWSSGNIKVDGDIVVAIPARDILLITGSRNRKGLKAVRTLISDLAKGPDRLTETLFVYRKGRFVKFGRD